MVAEEAKTRVGIRREVCVSARRSASQGTDYASKLLHLAWHPEANVIAAAASNSLYMYCA